MVEIVVRERTVGELGRGRFARGAENTVEVVGVEAGDDVDIKIGKQAELSFQVLGRLLHVIGTVLAVGVEAYANWRGQGPVSLPLLKAEGEKVELEPGQEVRVWVGREHQPGTSFTEYEITGR